MLTYGIVSAQTPLDTTVSRDLGSIVTYLQSQLRYPDLARELGIEGKVIISFNVSADGHRYGYRVAKGVQRDLDAEALLTVSSLPDSIVFPYYIKGESGYVIPINFKLSETPVSISKAAPRRVEVPHVYEQTDKLDQRPQYPGGDAAMGAFIDSNQTYPVIGMEMLGRVVVGFVINEDGSISDIVIRRSLHPAYDAEAIRLVKGMPKFIPGRLNGKAVKVRYVLPVLFK